MSSYYTLKFYYFKNNAELFSAFERRDNYDKPISQEGVKVVKTEENRYYFYGKNLIRWLSGKKTIDKKRYSAEGIEILEGLKKINHTTK